MCVYIFICVHTNLYRFTQNGTYCRGVRAHNSVLCTNCTWILITAPARGVHPSNDVLQQPPPVLQGMHVHFIPTTRAYS